MFVYSEEFRSAVMVSEKLKHLGLHPNSTEASFERDGSDPTSSF